MPATRVFAGKDLDEGVLLPIGLGLAAIFTIRAPDKATINEDSAAIIPFDEKSGILVVADGCGGLPQGAKASEAAINAVRSAIKNAQKKGLPLRTAILDGMDKAGKDVIALGTGSATTLAIAEISGDKLRCYHVGDSQIMLIGQRGRLKLQTLSHSPVGYAMEAGLIDEGEALAHAERHLVSNLVGDTAMRIEVGAEQEISPKDTIVIASDGLFDNLRTQEIVDTCRKGELLAISRKLQDICRERMENVEEGKPSKPDDLTFIVYRRRISD